SPRPTTIVLVLAWSPAPAQSPLIKPFESGENIAGPVQVHKRKADRIQQDLLGQVGGHGVSIPTPGRAVGGAAVPMQRVVRLGLPLGRRIFWPAAVSVIPSEGSNAMRSSQP